MMSELTKKILEEIREYYLQSEMQEGDVTTDMVAAELQISEESARLLMQRLVNDGKFVRLKMRVNGHKRSVYRPVK